MPYFLIEDFSKGLDVSREPASLPAGSLRYANNVHVTRGGELEKRKAFIPTYTLPPGSVGLTSDRDHLLVYGNGAQSLAGSLKWIDCGGEPDYMMDSARWANLAITTVQMKDGSRKLMLDTAPVTGWAYTGALPVALETLRGKVYAVEGANFYGSKLYDPSVWDAAAEGSFVADTAMQSQAMSSLNAVCVFQGSLVLFSENGIQVWEVDPDPAKNYLARSLTNSGCLAPRSVLNFGNFDTVFLARSGIRSIQARQATDIANVQDIGTPVDDFIGEVIWNTTVDALRRGCTAIVDPEDARLWVSLGDVVMVHSYYSGSNVAAWTTYTPGFTVDGMTVFNGLVYVRSGDVIYVYGGGVDGNAYDDCKAEVWTPFHHAQKPATKKAFTGIDLGCQGEWVVNLAPDPNRPDYNERAGRVVGTTYNEPSVTLETYTTHLSLVLESVEAGPVRLSNVAMHFTEGEAA